MKPSRHYVYTEHGEPHFDAAFLHMLAGAVRRHMQQGNATTAQAIDAQAANTPTTAKGQANTQRAQERDSDCKTCEWLAPCRQAIKTNHDCLCVSLRPAPARKKGTVRSERTQRA
jgi:hypothetical protein